MCATSSVIYTAHQINIPSPCWDCQIQARPSQQLGGAGVVLSIHTARQPGPTTVPYFSPDMARLSDGLYMLCSHAAEGWAAAGEIPCAADAQEAPQSPHGDSGAPEARGPRDCWHFALHRSGPDAAHKFHVCTSLGVHTNNTAAVWHLALHRQ